MASSSADEIIDSWTWGNRPSEVKLREALHLICSEQLKICGDASGTTLYSYRFRQRATVLKRYYIAQCRTSQNWSLVQQDCKDQQDLENENNTVPKSAESQPKKDRFHKNLGRNPKSFQPHPQGLARLGSRAALSFAFAFLRRAWRNGEDSDLCTDLLQGKIIYNV